MAHGHRSGQAVLLELPPLPLDLAGVAEALPRLVEAARQGRTVVQRAVEAVAALAGVWPECAIPHLRVRLCPRILLRPRLLPLSLGHRACVEHLRTGDTPRRHDLTLHLVGARRALRLEGATADLFVPGLRALHLLLRLGLAVAPEQDVCVRAQLPVALALLALREARGHDAAHGVDLGRRGQLGRPLRHGAGRHRLRLLLLLRLVVHPV
mmetsp:Transcript_40481/g.91969  ORF Transcript_40481/g.91969 Transcript_40481/m.91969 type:complete len:210 (-) Transcript_40481:394-1023(-)